TDQLRLLTAAIRQGHDELGRAMHDVTIGQKKPAGRKEKPRAVAPHVWGETWIRACRTALPAVHLNIDHRRAHAFRHAHHGLGIGIEELLISQRIWSMARSASMLGIIGQYQSEYRLHQCTSFRYG